MLTQCLLTHLHTHHLPTHLPLLFSFFTFTSFTEPGAIFRIDVAQGAAEAEPTLHRRIQTTGFSPDDFETKQASQSLCLLARDGSL